MIENYDKPQKIYFVGHRDAAIINDYLNTHPETSPEFKVVYHLRKMGEEFVDGTLTLEALSEYARLLPAPTETEAFIKQMRCYTFYSAICHIGQGMLLTPFEMQLKHELENPSWKGEANTFTRKLSRWWYTRWKHPLVYNEWWLPATVTWVWSIIRRKRILID